MPTPHSPAGAAAPAHSNSASFHICSAQPQPPLRNAQLRCSARDVASDHSHCTTARHSRLQRTGTACHALCPAASGGTSAVGNSTDVPPAAAGVSQAGSVKTFDVVHLGNLCLDIIVPVEQLPPEDTGAQCCSDWIVMSSSSAACCQPHMPAIAREWFTYYVKETNDSRHVHQHWPLLHAAVRAAMLAQLTAQPPEQSAWEVGGASNFMIAAARLGQRVASVGQLGDDVYGAFLRRVLQASAEVQKCEKGELLCGIVAFGLLHDDVQTASCCCIMQVAAHHHLSKLAGWNCVHDTAIVARASTARSDQSCPCGQSCCLPHPV